MNRPTYLSLLFFFLLSALGCSDADEKPSNGISRPTSCVIDGETPDYTEQLGCEKDFRALASAPLSASIPGARSAKIVIDRTEDNRLYFQNSNKYKIHWEFARAHLSGNGKPVVGELAVFNQTEYYNPDRRFILGALTYYEGPKAWVLEISPYDTADADLVTIAYRKISENTSFGAELRFHPTSESVERILKDLPDDVKVITSEEIFAGIDYQPLNLAEAYGRLRFVQASKLEEAYVNFRDIVVLDAVPNDISVVSGIITGEFQTPLSHINVLSQNRGTPNMGLRKATENDQLKDLEGKWVRLEVKALGWSIEETTQKEADDWWEKHRPSKVQIPRKDLKVTGLVDIDDLLDKSKSQKKRISDAIPAFGGKASHYAELASIKDVPVPQGFAIPISYYEAFMEEHGFTERVKELLDDEEFKQDAETRDKALKQLRSDIKSASVDPKLLQAVEKKGGEMLPGLRMRFRSSTNAEDLDGFTGAGLYTSKSGDPKDPSRPIEDAIREVWSSVWFFRAFEERSYRGISHLDVGMALLVHRSFPDEFANGVAVTANIFDTSGLEPGFFINVQRGEASVVLPEPGVTTDQLLYRFDQPGQPATYLGHSNQVFQGETVLTPAQLFELGKSLSKIHQHFFESYGPKDGDPTEWYAMDVEFKFNSDDPDVEPKLVVKQARPYPGRGK